MKDKKNESLKSNLCDLYLVLLSLKRSHCAAVTEIAASSPEIYINVRKKSERGGEEEGKKKKKEACVLCLLAYCAMHSCHGSFRY